MSKFKKKFLVITAHPDDLEMGCGGLVARVIKEGGSVTNLILVKPSAEHNPNRDEQTVQEELENSNISNNFGVWMNHLTIYTTKVLTVINISI